LVKKNAAKGPLIASSLL